MTTLRQLALGAGLLLALALLFWTQHQRLQTAQARADLATERQQQAEQRIERQATTIATLEKSLATERTAQARLSQERTALRQGLAARNQQIEVLKRENQELRDWAAQPLPAAARRLRERPAITGAAGYRQWLSSRNAMQPAAGQPSQ